MERFLYNLRESQKLFRHRLQLLDDHLKNNKFFNTFMKHLSKIAAIANILRSLYEYLCIYWLQLIFLLERMAIEFFYYIIFEKNENCIERIVKPI